WQIRLENYTGDAEMTTLRIDRSTTFTRRAAILGLTAALLHPGVPWAQSASGEGSPPATQESFEPKSGQPGKDVVWVPTPEETVGAMLGMAEGKAGAELVDPGAGDGRIAIAAGKRGARSLGIEYNEDMVAVSRRNAA